MNLYKLARNMNTASAVLSGNPRRIRRRGGNIAKGRVLARTGFWRMLWR